MRKKRKLHKVLGFSMLCAVASLFIVTKPSSYIATKVSSVMVNGGITAIDVTKYNQKLIVGDTYKVVPVITPAELSTSLLAYESSDPSVATVDAQGNVKALKSGSVVITIKSTDQSNVTAIINIDIKNYSDIKYNYNQFVAHMGLSTKEPANSIPAYVSAGQSSGFVGIESDVRETKDGDFVLYHDDNLSARTAKAGIVSQLTLDELFGYTLTKGTNITAYTKDPLRLPTLTEFLYICKAYGVKPVLHIKSITAAGRSRLLDKVREAGMMEQTIITGSKTNMVEFRKLSSEINLYWLCYLSEAVVNEAVKYDLHINTDYTYVTSDRVAYAKEKGRVVGAWTVNNINTVRKLFHNGVDFVTTDNDYYNKYPDYQLK